jgi:hypothetical protein
MDMAYGIWHMGYGLWALGAGSWKLGAGSWEGQAQPGSVVTRQRQHQGLYLKAIDY